MNTHTNNHIHTDFSSSAALRSRLFFVCVKYVKNVWRINEFKSPQSSSDVLTVCSLSHSPTHFLSSASDLRVRSHTHTHTNTQTHTHTHTHTPFRASAVERAESRDGDMKLAFSNTENMSHRSVCLLPTEGNTRALSHCADMHNMSLLPLEVSLSDQQKNRGRVWWHHEAVWDHGRFVYFIVKQPPSEMKISVSSQTRSCF